MSDKRNLRNKISEIFVNWGLYTNQAAISDIEKLIVSAVQKDREKTIDFISYDLSDLSSEEQRKAIVQMYVQKFKDEDNINPAP